VFYKFHALLIFYFKQVALCVLLFLSYIFQFLPQEGEICSAKIQKSIKGNLYNPPLLKIKNAFP